MFSPQSGFKPGLMTEHIGQLSGIAIVKISDGPCNGVSIYFNCKRKFRGFFQTLREGTLG